MRNNLTQHYLATRERTLSLCDPLQVEDYVIQSMDDVSPPKWHLAHTTWFFETFILEKYQPSYQRFHPDYHRLFNSYYNSFGQPFKRANRGLLARPTVSEIKQYRHYVDEQMQRLLERLDESTLKEVSRLVVLGLHHEMQHQELLLMDIKHIFSVNPLNPVYINTNSVSEVAINSTYIEFSGGETDIGSTNHEFCFDNELPAHRQLIVPFAISNRLVTNGEFLEFILDGGYTRPELWLSDGWATINNLQWRAPMYWQQCDKQWLLQTLSGLKPLNLNEPVCHVSFYEAEAFASWCHKRLPTEYEWEHVARQCQHQQGNFLDSKLYHPRATSVEKGGQVQQLAGDVWEWTASSYHPYPGYRRRHDALGEYNGKFMSSQMVLRGGSCVTPAEHYRHTYRNFFYPHNRWQFSGIRLADTLI